MRRMRPLFQYFCLLLLLTPSTALFGKGNSFGLLNAAASSKVDAKDDRAANLTRKVAVSPGFMARSAFAGAIAGTLLESVLYPVEALKTRVQTRATTPFSFPGLFKGVMANSVAMASGSFLFFMLYEPTTLIMRQWTKQASLVHLAGTTVGMLFSSLIQVPSDVIKTQVQSGVAGHPHKAFFRILKTEGVKGLYRGGGAWLMLNLPKTQLAFVLYAVLHQHYSNRFCQERQTTPLENSMLGCTQGIINGFLLTPVDTVRARLMNQVADAAMVRKSARQILVSVIKNEGVTGLFVGAQHRMMWMGLRGSIFFTALEACRHCFLPEIRGVRRV